MLSMSRLMGTKSIRPPCPFITHLEQTIKGNENFVESVTAWRNLEINYIGEVMALQTKLRDQLQQSCLEAGGQFLKILEIVVKSHKNMITKINTEIFEACGPTFTSIIEQQKNIINDEKCQNKTIVAKKQELLKLRDQQQKFKKSLLEELIQEIFSHNSITECSNKQKIVQKVEKLSEKQDEHEEKIQLVKESYTEAVKKPKENIRRFDNYQQNFVIQTQEVLRKAINNICQFSQSLLLDSQSYITNRNSHPISNPTPTSTSTPTLQKFQSQYEQILNSTCKGYLETTLQRIKNRTIDEMTDYTKDWETKKKIKNVIESTELSPEFTDEITRQVQLVKKMLRTKELSLMDQFKVIITKSCKFRMNFVFMLQLYRINSQFQMTENQIEPIIILINEILKISHLKKDAFVLKQIIILLLTYYITVKKGECQHKVYILHFFKKNKFWKDLQLWQSMLIQSIYTQKKSTIRMLLTTSCVSNKNQLAEAQKTLVLNQILYIVRNMLLFDFTQKEVKQFVNRFVKLLKQDDKFLKEVYKSIQNAMKEEQENQQPDLSELDKHQFSKIIINDCNL